MAVQDTKVIDIVVHDPKTELFASLGESLKAMLELNREDARKAAAEGYEEGFLPA